MSKNAGVTGYGEDFWHVLFKLQKGRGKTGYGRKEYSHIQMLG